RFLETPVETPAAIQSWWYPGLTTGHEFIYSRDQALRLAKSSSTGVLTDEGKTRVMPSGEEVKVENGKELAAPTTGKIQEGESPASDGSRRQPKARWPRPTPKPVTTTSPEAPPKTMPRTASSVSEVGVLGVALFCVGLGAMAVRASRRRPF